MMSTVTKLNVQIFAPFVAPPQLILSGANQRKPIQKAVVAAVRPRIPSVGVVGNIGTSKCVCKVAKKLLKPSGTS